jgi:hypothetical protein
MAELEAARSGAKRCTIGRKSGMAVRAVLGIRRHESGAYDTLPWNAHAKDKL